MEAFYAMKIHDVSHYRLQRYMNELNTDNELGFFVFDARGIRTRFNMNMEHGQIDHHLLLTAAQVLRNLIYRHYYGIKKRSRITPPLVRI